MATNDTDRLQDFQARVGALRVALDECLARLAVFYGDEAPQQFEALRDELINKFKNSEIPPERDLEHAKLVRPAIDVLETMFNAAHV